MHKRKVYCKGFCKGIYGNLHWRPQDDRPQRALLNRAADGHPLAQQVRLPDELVVLACAGACASPTATAGSSRSFRTTRIASHTIGYPHSVGYKF
jgi:hypothetical protein